MLSTAFYHDTELNWKKPHRFNDKSKTEQDKSFIEGFYSKYQLFS